ncbi:probable methyltransferase PMT23 isoform X2 [Cryptomeria japonica]|nr:probable methyltransferase PMT23 isoform X2 [Cryptomeria japonica]XP_059063642.1 probable methyltransferase PMT23 isoform X2 [Cryptomeria japonica]XP_059063643.1 probable methyltransferase PMT23 isoform X2 [Cryptomeria japonica]XP_059063644.1 probable methyltransferase PMT23 isoform X2 [Cryptomeria japonica]XP_059063645.1 probable methyltransferase PMT23 isoform X2 [Cryptomeria japonica]XP_059063647.1 probable methyltransferase PMT23 isoform X2 [Cryptomeria japonica]
MAFAKYLQEKKLPFLSLLVVGVICIGIFLFAFGMSSYPSEFHAAQIEAMISKDETKHVKSHDRRPDNSSSDLWHYHQQEVQNKNNSILKVKEPPDTDRDEKKMVAEGTQKHNVKQVAEGTQKQDRNQVTEEGLQKQDRNQVTEEGLQKQQNMSIAFGKQDDSVLKWDLCNGGPDFIPCLDNVKAIKKLASRRHMEHRERHCPTEEDLRRCLPPLPDGYRSHIHWPQSRDMIWLKNVPHTKLVEYKKDQNWVKISGKYLVFPGAGTQFKGGASSYINFIEKIFPIIAWGKQTRVVLDVGCGVASFGGHLLDKGVLTMSFAPKDEHEAQIQFALERGIPAILLVIGTQRLVFPSNVYDVIHCARCRVHWYGDGGKPLLEINRILRPGGYFVWSATPVYRDDPQDHDVWQTMVALTESMCWKLVLKTTDSTGIGIAIYQKPTSNSCYIQRKENDPPLCDDSDRPDGAWYVPLQRCLHKIPTITSIHGSMWPPKWPLRLEEEPFWLKSMPQSTDGSARDFHKDTIYWRHAVQNQYLHGLGIDWSFIRNVMDMKSGYGGFAAALVDEPVWVMNVVPTDGPDTLPVIFDRGLVGVYHDWCESFNTYPRTYDLLHADHLFSNLAFKCNMVDIIIEMDRILRPQGWVIIHDTLPTVEKLLPVMRSLKWRTYTKITEENKKLIVAQKDQWRPEKGPHVLL